MLRNNTYSETALMEEACQALRNRLPTGWNLTPQRGGLPGSSSRSDTDGVLILSDPQGMTANIVVEANPRPVEARRVSVLTDRWARQLHPRRGRGPALPVRSRRQHHRRPRPRRHESGGEHPHRHTGRRPLAGGLLPMAPAAPDVGTPAAGNRRNWRACSGLQLKNGCATADQAAAAAAAAGDADPHPQGHHPCPVPLGPDRQQT